MIGSSLMVILVVFEFSYSLMCEPLNITGLLRHFPRVFLHTYSIQARVYQ
jgi:hypothetical protein